MLKLRTESGKGIWKSKKGFTLVELLIVIAIIGILAVVLLVQLGGSRAKARDAKRISDVGQIQTAVELYYNDCGYYPNLITGGAGPSVCNTATGDLRGYLASTLTDPSGAVYNYGRSPSGTPTRYQVWMGLEGDNPALKSDTDLSAAAFTSGSGLGGVDGSDASCAATPSQANCKYDVGQ